MPGYGSLCTIVDRLLSFWQKCLKSIIYSRRRQEPPWGVAPSNAGGHALIDRAKLDFRDMREVGGLIVHRECSQGQGFARFARSLTDEVPRIETISRVIPTKRGMRGRVN